MFGVHKKQKRPTIYYVPKNEETNAENLYRNNGLLGTTASSFLQSVKNIPNDSPNLTKISKKVKEPDNDFGQFLTDPEEDSSPKKKRKKQDDIL